MSRHGLTNFALLIVVLFAPVRGWAEVDPCREDFNADLSIGVADAAMLRSCMTGPVTDNANIECVKADFQRDHHIDLLDAAAQYNNFGPCHLCPGEWVDNSNTLLGLSGSVLSMTVFDDGNGNSLYAGGTFTIDGCAGANNIAKWDGTAWSALDVGTNGTVNALVVFDDGTSKALYAAGSFSAAGDVTANYIARWNGLTWDSLGDGMNGPVNALAVFDDGDSRLLYAGGWFTGAGGVAANRIARWDGIGWSGLGSGMDYMVSSLSAANNGDDHSLFAGGWFTLAGDVNTSFIAKWDGKNWHAVETPWPGEPVSSLYAFDDGIIISLFAGSEYAVSRLDGQEWVTIGTIAARSGGVRTIGAFDDGRGAALIAGGRFDRIGGTWARNLAKWDRLAWSSLGDGLYMKGICLFQSGCDSARALAMTMFDDGTGPALFVGGRFELAGVVPSVNIGKWQRPATCKVP